MKQIIKGFSLKLILVLLSSLLLAACSFDDVKDTIGIEDYAIEYKKSKQVDTLEVPPGLSSSRIEDSMVVPGGGTASYSDTQQNNSTASRRKGVLPEQKDITVQRDGNTRWLVVNAPPEQVWPKLREFWLDFGFLLKVENPDVGIMETDWKENRADIPTDFVRDLLSKFMDTAYSAPTRDMFRIRVEQGDSKDQTEIFVSHRGVLEKITGDETTVWETRPSEPGLEAEMLRRIMVFMGTEDDKARARLAKVKKHGDRARLIKDRSGNAVIDFRSSYPRAWRIVGLALDRVGFTVEDRDRSKGLYYVRYSDPLADVEKNDKGILSSLIFWGSDEKPSEEQYQVNLAGDESSTQIVVLDKNGKRDQSRTSRRILTLLYEQIK